MSGNNGNSQGGAEGGGQWHSDGRYATYMNQSQGYPTAYPGYPTQDNGLIYHNGGGAAPSRPPIAPPTHDSSSMANSISHHPRITSYESSIAASTMNHQSMSHHNSDLASLEYPLHDEQDNSPITTARQSYNQSD